VATIRLAFTHPHHLPFCDPATYENKMSLREQERGA